MKLMDILVLTVIPIIELTMTLGLLIFYLKASRSVRVNAAMFLFVFATVWTAGCSSQRKQTLKFSADCGPCQTMLQQIEYPDLVQEQDTDGSEYLTGPPLTLKNYEESASWELTLEQCVELALKNSKIMQKLGGLVVVSPGGVTTLYDPAIVETGQGGVESALSAFDAQLNSSFFYDRKERVFNNPILAGGAASQISNRSNFNFEIAKQTATGASFALRNLTSYDRNNNPIFNPPTVPFGNLFGSAYDMVQQLELRQPLGRGRGTMVNRIAGPNATPGTYNGVLIARIRGDISLADFESAVRDLVRDVEINYWELYFAYRDLEAKLTGREYAKKTWENRRLRYENGIGRPDDEAQARQQYFIFDAQAQNALAGVLNGQPGVLGADRNLRRLMGVPSAEGTVIRPISDPSLAPVVFDWDRSQAQAIERRVEIRRQKWTIRQRELELIAAKALNTWRFDFVGQYGFRGFGDKLLSAADSPNGGAFNDSIKGDLNDWQLGLELGGAIGNRQGHLAIRNAELNLARERAILKEQQSQISHDLSAAYIEVDRAMENLKTNFNSRVAAQEDLEPKVKRVLEGQDQVFFLLDAEQRVANAESAVFRSVADYNQALLNYSYVSGTLLSRFNIQLTEGLWSDAAQCNAIKKASMFRQGEPNRCDIDTCPVSFGQFNQSALPIVKTTEKDLPTDVDLSLDEGQSFKSPPYQIEPLTNEDIEAGNK